MVCQSEFSMLRHNTPHKQAREGKLWFMFSVASPHLFGPMHLDRSQWWESVAEGGSLHHGKQEAEKENTGSGQGKILPPRTYSE